LPQPSQSNILLTLVDGDSVLWPSLEVDELLFNGESAEYEQMAGMLEDAIASVFSTRTPGTYFLYGFRAFYSKDYYGEVDVDYELDGWRVATADDAKEFYDTSEVT